MEVNDTEKIVVMLFNSSLFVKPTPLNGSRGGALGGWGGPWGPPPPPPPQPPNFRLKKKKKELQKEEKPAGQATKNRAPL